MTLDPSPEEKRSRHRHEPRLPKVPKGGEGLVELFIPNLASVEFVSEIPQVQAALRRSTISASQKEGLFRDLSDIERYIVHGPADPGQICSSLMRVCAALTAPALDSQFHDADRQFVRDWLDNVNSSNQTILIAFDTDFTAEQRRMFAEELADAMAERIPGFPLLRVADYSDNPDTSSGEDKAETP